MYTCKIPAEISIEVAIKPDYYGTTVLPQTITANANQTVQIDFLVPTMRTISGSLKNCTGMPVKGRVVLTWIYSSINYYSTVFSKNDGTFSLPINVSGYNAMIHAYGNETSKHVPVPDTVNNVGNIILCPPITTGLNGFTYRGLTYNSFNDIKTGTYYVTNNYTSIYASGTDGYISIEVPGNNIGQFPISAAKSITACYISITSTSYYNSLTTGTINVTKYNNVNGLIEGTFSGTIIASGDTSIVTGGKFSVVRQSDYIQPAK